MFLFLESHEKFCFFYVSFFVGEMPSKYDVVNRSSLISIVRNKNKESEISDDKDTTRSEVRTTLHNLCGRNFHRI